MPPSSVARCSLVSWLLPQCASLWSGLVGCCLCLTVQRMQLVGGCVSKGRVHVLYSHALKDSCVRGLGLPDFHRFLPSLCLVTC